MKPPKQSTNQNAPKGKAGKVQSPPYGSPVLKSGGKVKKSKKS